MARRPGRRRPGALTAALLALGAAALLAGLAGYAALRPGPAPERATIAGRPPGTAPPPMVIQREADSVAKLLQGQRDVIRIEVSDSAIAPAVLYARAETELHLHLHNAGTRPHNFLIPEFGIVTQRMPPGGENYVAFTPSRPGAFPYFSGDPRSHLPEPGLEGTLQVSS